MIVVDSSTRQFTIPATDQIFGVEADAGSEVKYFQAPRYVGNNLDLAGSFLRINYRNANLDEDSYLIQDVTMDGDNIRFSWKLTPRVTAYKGEVKFVLCATSQDQNVAWHTTLGSGKVLEGLEPDNSHVEEETSDVVAQLIAMVEAQTEAVEAEGSKQIKTVQTAAQTAQSDAVAQIEAKGVNTRNSIPADYTALNEAVDTVVQGKAPAIVCSAEGFAITANDASDMAIQGMKIFGRSTQDGTPTPDAPVEIKSVVEPVVTVCGKNLLGGNVLADSIVGKMNGTKDESAGTVNFYCTYASQKILFDQFKPDTMYTFIFKGWNTYGDGTNLYVQYTDGTLDYLTFSESKTESTALLKTDQNKSILHFSGTYYSGMTYLRYNECGVFEGDIDVSEFEPYSGQAVELTHTLPGIPVASGGNYTDSDGQQWICDEVDLERGVYVQRVGLISYDGNEDWTLNVTGDYVRFMINQSDAAIGVSRTAILCNLFTSDNMKTDRVGLCFVGSAVGGYLYFYPNADITSLDEWLAWLAVNNVNVVYRLTTPIETPLSETEIAAYRALHTNKPNTTIINDSGAHMAVEYVADTKLYIDNKFAALGG